MPRKKLIISKRLSHWGNHYARATSRQLLTSYWLKLGIKSTEQILGEIFRQLDFTLYNSTSEQNGIILLEDSHIPWSQIKEVDARTYRAGRPAAIGNSTCALHDAMIYREFGNHGMHVARLLRFIVSLNRDSLGDIPSHEQQPILECWKSTV